MPAPDAIDRMFQSLVSNGVSYLRRSIDELESQTKVSVAHFAAGLELILKARLFHEHWALVASNPHSTAWSSINDGSFKSIAAADLVSTLANTTDKDLKKERVVFKEVFDHRNRALHFVPSDDVESVAAEQYRSWYYLHRLLDGPWKDVFSDHSGELEELDRSFRAHTACLGVRFDELKQANKFVAAAHRGALVDCLVCGHESGILEEPGEHLSKLDCPVCLSTLDVARFGCDSWVDASGGLYEPVECSCGKQHWLEELARLIDDSPALSPKEEDMRGEILLGCGHCCQDRSVAHNGSKLLCVGCGAEFEEEDCCSCAYCQRRWAGYDCSNTRWRGCESCEGESSRLRYDD